MSGHLAFKLNPDFIISSCLEIHVGIIQYAKTSHDQIKKINKSMRASWHMRHLKSIINMISDGLDKSNN